jgi:hypothetical protein
MSNAATNRHSPEVTEDLLLSAFNAAFYELGLRWYWDEDLYRDLRRTACEKERVHIYLQTYQSHLLTAYEADFLIEAILTAKARHYDAMLSGGMRAAPSVDWAAVQRYRRDI